MSSLPAHPRFAPNVAERRRAGGSGAAVAAGALMSTLAALAVSAARADVPTLVTQSTQQAALAAQGAQGDRADQEFTIDVDPVMVELPPPPGAGREWRSVGQAPAPQLSAGTRTMLWSRSGAWQWGMGVEQPAATASFTGSGLAPTGTARVLLGAAVDTSATTQLAWRTPLSASTLAREAQQPRTMEFSLVLKPQDALANLRRGSLMKMTLSGQTQLSLRPRGGGRITLQLTSKW